MKKHTLVLLRHGESQWNLENRFTGWTDVDLTDKGIREAKSSGKIMKEGGFNFNLVYTSVLKRVIQTMDICLSKMGISDIPIKYNWRLNERHYGALQGLNKAETAQKYGDDQVLIWRRSYSTQPPPLELDDERHPRFDDRYSNLTENELPASECLKDTVERFLDRSAPPHRREVLRSLSRGGGAAARAPRALDKGRAVADGRRPGGARHPAGGFA